MGNSNPNAIRSYRDLVAWQRAYSLGLAIYRATKPFPVDERFGLTSQLRRSGVSIASNIAEGYGRGNTNEYVRFLKIARGSLYEVETQLLFAQDLEYLDATEFQALSSTLNETARVLSGLIAKLEQDGA